MASIYQKQISVIRDYPAMEVIELEKAGHTAIYTNGDKDAINLKAGDSLYELKRGTKHMIGSVASSALEDGKCPFEARERAEKHGHDLYFIFGLGSCLTAHDQPKETFIGVTIGDKVNFEGKQFTIVEQWNRNIGLELVTE